MIRTALPDTALEIQTLHAKASYRAMARELGLDHRIWPPTLRRIALGGTVSLYKENVVRRALGLPAAYPATIETPACPDCGGVHTGRCNGVVNPVVIVKRQRPAKPAWVIEATANLARLLEDKP